LLDRLAQIGANGELNSLDVEDENLEAVFDLLVGETA
jgi:hypothetical protein